MQVKAKKHFGQNFLRDESVKKQIIEAIPNSDKIVEIGPGLGDLTRGLLSKTEQLACFEIDTELFVLLEKKFANELNSGHLELFCKDALNAWQEISQKPYFLAANLPYYVATNIILRALRDENCAGLVVMIQREVALKFCAKAGQSEFCALSLLAALHGECELLFDVPPAAFEPAPKVFSSVIRLMKTKSPDCDIRAFENFLKIAFSSPRKTLLKNLSAITEKSRLESIFSSLNIALNIRPHELNLTLFLKIFNEVRNGREK